MIFESRLRADVATQLNSPGSKGRIGGGYGGFFWRFPACENVEVFTDQARGEDESTAAWRHGWRGLPTLPRAWRQRAGHHRHRSARRGRGQ